MSEGRALTPRLHLAGEQQPAKRPLTIADVEQLSLAADLTIHLADAIDELRDALRARDPELTMRACRRLVGFGGLYGVIANEIERIDRLQR